MSLVTHIWARAEKCSTRNKRLVHFSLDHRAATECSHSIIPTLHVSVHPGEMFIPSIIEITSELPNKSKPKNIIHCANPTVPRLQLSIPTDSCTYTHHQCSCSN